jgi:branched-chain amino acid transport system permease protein
MIKLMKKNKVVVGIVCGGMLLSVLPFTGISVYHITFLFILIMNVALTVGWNILGGYAGYYSFGHVAFVGAGGYTTAILLTKLGWSPLLTTPIAGVTAAVIALIIGYPCLRLRGPYFSLITLIVALAVKVIVVNLPGINTAGGIFVTPPAKAIFASRMILFEAMAVVMVITLITAYLIESSRFGIGLKAIREDEEVAGTQGIDTAKMKFIAFVISAGLAGLVGGIFSWYQGFLFPDPMFSTNLSVMIVLMAFLGGTNSWVGALTGAVLVTVVREFLNLSIGSTMSQVVFGVLLVVTILYLPNGVIGWFTERFSLASIKKSLRSVN